MFFVETLSNAQNIMIISDQKFSQIALYFLDCCRKSGPPFELVLAP